MREKLSFGESGKEVIQLFSERLGVVLAKIYKEDGRLLQKVGQFVGKSS